MTASSIKVNAFGKVILFPAGTSADEIESTLNAQEHLLNPDYNKPSQNSIVESAKGIAKDLLGIDVDGIYQDFKNSGKSIADLAEESSLKGENTAATQIVGAPVRQSAYNQALQDPTFGIKPNDSLIPRKPDRFGILSRIRDAANKDGSGQEFQSNLSNAITDAAPDPEGGFIPSAISTAGQTIKGVGRIGSDYLGYDKNNPIAAYGQKLIDENPVAVRGLEDIQDKPFIAVKEALGSSAPSMAGMVGAKALGVGITSLAPLTGPAAPIIAAVGIAVQWLGPAAVASLPSYSSIRDKQILNDPENESDGKSKAIAALGAGAVGVIEQAFGPQQWALSMMTKEGRSALARKFAATTTIGAITKGAVKGGVIEASEELAQNPIEQLASFDDPTTDESIKETLFSGAMGALGGGVMGGTIAGASNISNGGSSGILKEKERLAKMKADAENERNLKSGLDNINSAQNVDEAIQAAVETVSTKPVTKDDVLRTVDPGLADIERLTGMKPSESVDQAINQAQQGLNVNPISSQADTKNILSNVNVEGQFSQPTEEISNEEEINQEAGSSTSSTGILGNKSEIVLPDGATVPAQWQVVDADSVKASIKEGINQPRDRTRAASDIQIKSIANNPDYRRLSDSPIMDVGAPVLSHDGLIVGGNGRFEGISQAHSQGTGKEYLRTLKEDAINKGIDPALIDGMKSPVLVRRITQPFDTRKLAIASNSGLTLEMSPLEKAHVDAERMVGVEDLDITDNGDIALTEKNYVKLKDVLSDYNVSELGSLADKNLRLSPEGVKRIKNALLSKAFGNSEILSRIIDSTSDDMRNVHGALIKSAGVVAKTKAEILSGKVPDALDITENLLGAVETFAQIRAKGQPLDNYLAQDDLASERIDADTQEILKFLHDNIRSQKKLTEFIKHAYSQISNIDQSTEDIFGDNIVPSKKEIIQDAKQNTTDRPEATQQGFFDKSSEKSGQADGQEYKTEEGNVGSGKESGKESGLRKGKVGEKLVAGDIVLTASGRETTPFPKIDLDSKGKATNTLKRVDAWLIDNAIKEAESRGDKFNLLQFRNVSLKNLSQADKDSAELYLFEKQPDVVKSIFKDKFKNKDDAKFSRTPEERLKDRERAKQLERKLREQGFDFTVTAKDVRDFTAGDRGKADEADAAEKIAKIFGRRIVWIEARGDHAINGVVIPSIKDTIFIDVNTDKAAHAVMGHELSHHLEHDKPEVYKELTRSLMTVIRDHPGYAKKYGIEGARQSDITKEIVGDIMGDNFTKPEFWSRVAEANPSVFKNIAHTIISWLRRLIINAKARSLGSEQWVTDAQKAQDIVAKAVAQYTSQSNTPASGKAKFHSAFHGSPHDHDKFDSSKIGTGEGAQAYGHGLYFADNKDVAEYYKNVMTGKSVLFYKGERVADQNGFFAAQARNVLAYKDREKGLRESIEDLEFRANRLPEERAEINDAINELRKVNFDSFEERKSHLYQVELAPKQDEYLLWDRPLSEQSDKVIASLENKFSLPSFDKDFGTAGEFYRSRARKFDSQEKASSELYSLGIRGIKYIDGSSRHKKYVVILSTKKGEFSRGEFDNKSQAEEYANDKREEGFTAEVKFNEDANFNYVIFDENDVTITAKFSKKATDDQNKQTFAQKVAAYQVLDAKFDDDNFIKNLDIDSWEALHNSLQAIRDDIANALENNIIDAIDANGKRLLSRNSTDSGNDWRITSFDADGDPLGHSEYRNARRAVDDLFVSGINQNWKALSKDDPDAVKFSRASQGSLFGNNDNLASQEEVLKANSARPGDLFSSSNTGGVQQNTAISDDMFANTGSVEKDPVLPEGFSFTEGKGLIAGRFAVSDSNGDTVSNFHTDKQKAAQEFESNQYLKKQFEEKSKRNDEIFEKISNKLLAGGKASDEDLKGLDLKQVSRFDYISPVIQKLFGISKSKVRDAMGSALFKSQGIYGGETFEANSKSALENAAKFVNSQNVGLDIPRDQAAGKIEDFGEKIGGARKDMERSLNREYTDDDIATQPLSKIWPKDDYLNIENPFLSAFYYAAREEIPTKPKLSYRVKSWVQKVKMFRGLAKLAVTKLINEQRIIEFSKEFPGLDNFFARVQVLSRVPNRQDWSRVESVAIYPDSGKYDSNGIFINTPMAQIKVDGRTTVVNVTDIDRVAESVNNLLQKEKPNDDKKMQFELRGRTGSYFINKKGDREYRKLKTFTDLKEASQYLKNNYDDLVAAWELVKESDNVKKTDVRGEENRPRTGQDWRQGKDVTPDQFQSAFGFRGVEFGNWVSQGKDNRERQGMLNQAYDALMDLSNIVGVPPKALSLNGSLGLGFGSRGKGAALAHFEPGALVINLTKTKGAGNLAHEWFHAMDNYFQRQRGELKPVREDMFITYRPEQMMMHKKSGSLMTQYQIEKRRLSNPTAGYFSPENWVKDPNHPMGVRPEVEAKFSDLVKTLDESPMKKRAEVIDKGKEDGYWSRIIERAARSFENYVIAKMMKKGYNNDYLANVTNAEDFARDKERYPYLLESEVAPVEEAFDNLFAEIKTKETDKGIAMFSRASIPETININGVERPTRNSEGKLIPNPEKFYEWFGDSKVVDDQGRPMVVYHGTDVDFSDFNKDKINSRFEYSFGFHFTDDKKEASIYADSITNAAENFNPLSKFAKPAKEGGHVLPTYIKSDNPLIIRTEFMNASMEADFNRYDIIHKIMDSRKTGNPYDGVVIVNEKGNEYDNVNYVVFEPNQIKSAIGNNGQFSSDNDDIMFSFAGKKSETAEGVSPERTNSLDIPRESRFRKFQRKYQDSFNRFTVVKEWLVDKGINLSQQADVYAAEERYHAKIANQVEDFREQIRNPLIEKIAKAGFTMDDIADYLEAQHAPEANAAIRKLRDDPEATAYGIADDEAREYLSKAPGELGKLANELRSITEQTKKLRLDGGLLNKDITDAWEATYKHYIPVKGSEQGNSGTGKGMSVKVKNKRRLGHGRRDEAVIENILQDHERAIMEVEKNRVGKHVVMMAAEIGIPELMTIGQPVKRQMLRNTTAYEVQVKGRTKAVFDTKEGANLFRQSLPLTDKKIALSDVVINPTADQRVVMSASPMLADNEINVYVDGHAIRVQINDELMARAYKKLGIEGYGEIVSAGRMLNSYLSKVYTGYNPEFIMTNMVRDFTTGVINLTGEQGLKMAAKAISNYPKSFATLLRYAATNGKQSTDWIDAYRRNGGNTGAAYLSDMERLGNEVASEYAAYQGVIANLKQGDMANAARAAGRKAYNATLKWIYNLNQAGENAMRLSAFKAMIDSGMTVNDAAKAAKNITVNFNRKGELGVEANAAYLFFNASVQGTAATLHALVKGKNKYQAWALASGLTTLGYLAAASLGGGSEDDYDKIDDYTKERNALIKSGDGYLKLPIPYGYGFFWNVGRSMADAQRKDELHTMPWHIAASAIEELTPFGSIVVGSDGEFKSDQVLGGALPTVAQIPYQISNNKQLFSGGELMPDSPFDQSQPDREKMWRGTKGTMYDQVAGWLAVAGMDVSPETLKFMTRTATGGAGALVDSSVSAVMLKTEGAELDTEEMPFIRKAYKEISIKDTRSAFYKAREEAKLAAEEFNRARRKNDLVAMQTVINDKKEMLALDAYADKLSEVIRYARDQQDAVRLNKDIPIAEKRLRLKELEVSESKFYDKYLDVFNINKIEMRKRVNQ